MVARGDAASAARFLREHATRLDKTQIGELFGHHEEHSVEVGGSKTQRSTAQRSAVRSGWVAARGGPSAAVVRRTLHLCPAADVV